MVIHSGSQWFAWLVSIATPNAAINAISDWIYNVTKAGQDGNITAVFALPYQAFDEIDVDDTTHKVMNGKGTKLNEDVKYNLVNTRKISGFTPKNNKLLTYPYSFLRITNNLGSVNDYKFEDFQTDEEGNIVFNIVGVPCVGFSGKIRPKNYQGFLYNEDESLNLGKYPTLSWSSDGFTNWLTQNAVNLGISSILAVAGATAQFAEGKVVSGTLTVAGNIAQTVGSFYNSSLGSNTAQGNANAGDVSFSQNINRFKVAHMRPKLEYLRIIDDYFTRFGYKINRLTLPNIVGRKNWNYVEIGANEEIGYGSVPAKYMDIINNACRSGVTIWHNHSNVGNYALDNSIV